MSIPKTGTPEWNSHIASLKARMDKINARAFGVWGEWFDLREQQRPEDASREQLLRARHAVLFGTETTK